MMQKYKSGYEHITPTLHWLQSPERTDFKLASGHAHLPMPAFWLQFSTLPIKLSLSPVVIILAMDIRLSTVSNHALPVDGSCLWNSLQCDIPSAPMLTVFRNHFKTYLFQFISFLFLVSAVLYIMYSGLDVFYIRVF